MCLNLVASTQVDIGFHRSPRLIPERGFFLGQLPVHRERAGAESLSLKAQTLVQLRRSREVRKVANEVASFPCLIKFGRIKD